ncbi:transposase [Paenibacillus agricola]|uniref:IS110 family transposase n=1 Tax=Paenibacillus agricola TaxID=2716264 RepID=A0ABX0JMH8_9BACL|nr:transposase [Paenibacillus agricola]NHN35385.1 IS110 family transposase [Paenibacillus agricola]
MVEQGYVDADDVDDCVRGTIKNKKAQVTDSLFGTMTAHQIRLIKDCWEHIEYLEKSVARLEEEIHAHLQPYRQEYELLQTVPGISEITAAALIAEIGIDMNPFPTADHLASWAGVAPGNHESAGKKKVQKA